MLLCLSFGRLLAISVPVIYGSNILIEATIPSEQLCPLGFVEAKTEKRGITKSEEKHPANGYWAWPYEVVWRASLAGHKLPVNEHHGSNTGQEALTRSSHAVNQDGIHTWEQD